MSNHFLKLLVAVCVLVCFSRCKKIDLPNDQAKQLIGKWLIQTETCTGLSYAAASNPDASSLKNLVFKANGKCKEKSGVITTGSDTFEVIVQKTGNGEVNVIKYGKKGQHTFRISNDSLFILDGSCSRIYKKDK